MQRKIFTYLILGGLVGLGWISKTAAQTIKTGTIATSVYCAPGKLSVTFTIDTTVVPFGKKNVFSVQLSDALGVFSNPRVLAPTGTTSPLTVDLPGDLPNSNNYKVRVVSSAPQVNSLPSITVLTINAKPSSPSVATTSYNYCVGATATQLSATASGGNTLQWYNSAGTAIASAPTPPTNLGTKIYRVSQVSTAGCESAKVDITVVVNAKTETPKDETLSLCEGSSADPLKAKVANARWYTTATGGTRLDKAPTPSTATVGPITYYFSEIVGDCESERAQFFVTIKAKSPDPIVAEKEKDKSFCFGQAVTFDVKGTGLKWYEKNDKSIPRAPEPFNPGEYTYKVTQTTNGCESGKVELKATIYQTPAPVAKPDNYTYCLNATATTLEGTAKGTELKWYTTETGGTSSATGPTPLTTKTGSTKYYVSQTLNGCESSRATVTVQVNAIPGPPKVSALSICKGTSASPLSVDTGTGLLWYTVATGGEGSTQAPTPKTNKVDTLSFFVSQTVTGCESPRAKLVVIIKDTPLAPTVTTPVEYCLGQKAEPLTATGTALKWYNATGGTLPAAPTPTTSAAGSTTYQVSQTAAGCEGPRATIIVTVYKTVEPVVTSTVEYCKDEPRMALKATGTALKWYTTSMGGTGSIVAPVPNTATVMDSTYYVSQTKNNCESDRARIDVKVKPIPVVPTVSAIAPICQSSVASPLIGAVSGVTGTLKWYSTATGGTGSGTVPKPPTDKAVIVNYYVTQTVNNCESPRATLSLDIKALPAQPTATTAVDFCESGASQALSATGSNLRWYTVAAGGTSSSTAPSPATSAVGTTSYYVSQTTVYPIGSDNLSCEGPRTRISVQVNPLPIRPGVTPFEAVCQERQSRDLPFKANGEQLKWYTNASGGSALNGTPSINLKDSQEIAYYVSQTSNKGCEGARSEVKIRVKRLPALPGVTPSTEYCQFDKPNQLTASAETNAALNWYGTNATGGNRNGVAPTPSTDNGGETNFYVSQTLEGCEGDRSPIRIFIKTTDKPGVTTPISYCQNVTAQPLSALGRDLKWYREPSAPESQTTPFTPFTANVGDYAFYVTQTGTNGCESPKETINIRIKPLPSATITGDNSISLGASSRIKVEFTGDGPWNYALSNGLTGTGETQNPLTITVSPERTTTYTVTEVANVCGKGVPNGSAIVTVKIPTVSTGNPTIASLCAGKSFTLPFQQSGDFVQGNKFNVQISLTEADAGFRSIPTVTTGSDAVATIPDSAAGGNYFVRVVGESPQFVIKGSTSPVQVTVSPKPTATLAGATTILFGETTAVNVAFTGGSPWTFNFNNGRRDSLITTSVTPFVINVKPDTTTTYKLTSVANSCGEGRVSGTARIQVDPILGTEPIITAAWLNAYPSPVQTICVVEIENPSAGEAATIQVVDTRGRILSTLQTRSNRAEVDFTNRAAGVYFLKVENGGRTGVRRILKVE